MINIQHMNKTFHLKTGDVEALNDVSLNIEAGRFTASLAIPVRASPRWCAASIYWKRPTAASDRRRLRGNRHQNGSPW